MQVVVISGNQITHTSFCDDKICHSQLGQTAAYTSHIDTQGVVVNKDLMIPQIVD